MERKKGIIAAFLAVMVFFVLLYSVLFTIAKIDHDCVGEGCPVCYQFNVCQSILKGFSAAMSVAVFAAAFAYTLYKCIPACTDAIENYTLVSLKIKLSD